MEGRHTDADEDKQENQGAVIGRQTHQPDQGGSGGGGEDHKITQAELVGQIADERIKHRGELHEGVQCPGHGQRQRQFFDHQGE